MQLSYRLFKVWRRDLIVWSKYLSSSIVANVGEPLLYLIAIGYGLGSLVQNIGGMPYVEFIAPAILISSVMNAASFETTFSSYTRMQTQKTFQGIAVTPVSMQEVVAGEILWAATKALFNGFFIFLVLWAFGLVKHWQVIGLFPILFLTGLMFASLGMLFTGFASSYDFFSYYFTLFISPMFLFSGTFFPLEQLPLWAQKLAWLLPLTPATQITRSLFNGVFQIHHLGALLYMVVAILIIGPLAIRKVSTRLIR